MRDEEIVPSTVEGISDPSPATDRDALAPYVFQIHAGHFQNGAVPHVAAAGFAGAETVNLWKFTDGTWVKVYSGGSAVQLTATNPQQTIFSEGVYGVTKSADTGITVTAQMP